LVLSSAICSSSELNGDDRPISRNFPLIVRFAVAGPSGQAWSSIVRNYCTAVKQLVIFWEAFFRVRSTLRRDMLRGLTFRRTSWFTGERSCKHKEKASVLQLQTCRQTRRSDSSARPLQSHREQIKDWPGVSVPLHRMRRTPITTLRRCALPDALSENEGGH
jgi:hypothetical protein